MATWWNIFSLSLTVAICVGAILAVICVVRQVSSSIQSTKESLKTRGISISKEGVSVKTDKRFDREHYIDATQRGIMKAMVTALALRVAGREQPENSAESDRVQQSQQVISPRSLGFGKEDMLWSCCYYMPAVHLLVRVKT
ncbi:hypothetical protein V8B97DRAFT_1466572 [Scleroderma yunnanense]